MKTLLLAEACNPEWTSVPLVGFNLVHALSRRSDLSVVLATHVRNQKALERHEISKNIEIVYINNEWITKPLYQLGRLLRGGQSLGWTTNMAVNFPAYAVFEKTVGREFAARLKQREFDLIHRITPVSPTLPSPLASMTSVPMVIGPLNGGLPWPKHFPELHRSEREWLTPIRNSYRYLPWHAQTYRRLAGVISGSRHTASELPAHFTGQHFYQPENGVDPACFSIAKAWTPPAGDWQFVTVGRLVPYKGFDMILKAMSESPVLKTCRLVIIGDGPQRENLQQQAAAMNLSERVHFAGWLPQPELAAELRRSQAFVFPSLREFGGGVVLEAMASGLPCIAVDYGGPGELLDERSGILLPMSDRERMVTELTTAMESLVMDEDRSRKLAEFAIRQVHRRFTWERKADQIRQIYEHILHPRSSAKEGVSKQQDVCDTVDSHELLLTH